MLQKLGIEGIYIIHAKTGYELHENRIKTIFGGLGLDYEFVTDGDPSLFTDNLLSRYFCGEIKSKLKTGILSCTLNHILSYERIIRDKNRYALVFENDPFFTGDFVKEIELIAKEADTLLPGFIISLENTLLEFPHYSVIKKNKYLYPVDHGRFAGAYLIDLKAAQDILVHLKTTKCCTAIDLWHNTLIDSGVTKMYWAYPAIIEQGSHIGMMSSTISSKQKNVFRRIKWLSQKYYKTYAWRWFGSK